MSDTPDLTAWIGRTETATDLITPRLMASFQVILTPHLATGLAVPLGLHWCRAPLIAPAAQQVDGRRRRTATTCTAPPMCAT